MAAADVMDAEPSPEQERERRPKRGAAKLREDVERLNRRLDTSGPESPWWLTLDCQGGRYRLQAKGGARDVGPRLSAKEMAVFLDGFYEAIAHIESGRGGRRVWS